VRPQDLAKMVEVAARNGITVEGMNAAYQQRTNMLLPLVSALLLFPMAMLLRRIDRSRRLADHVLTMASITNSAFVLCIVMMPVAFLGKWAFVAAAQLASISYMTTALVRFYPARTRLRTGLRIVGFLLVNYAIALVLTIAMMIGVIASIIRF
jgi:lipopolysaccharide export LptBFGC system permease protein LptF